jgi:serine---pyruvate transaminase
MLSKFRLPGPTPLPPAVLAAMQQEMIPHRTPEFRAFYRGLLDRMQVLHRTTNDVMLWPGSGSAGWEIAVANLLFPGDSVIAIINGHFGTRFADVAEIFGIEVHRIEIPWGEAATRTQVEQALDQFPDAKAIFLTHNETSTGVTNPVADLAAAARAKGVLTLVDAVSSAAGLPLEIDEWDLDFVLSGSQKAWMCPPGLSIIVAGDRVWESIGDRPRNQFFWDLRTTRAAALDGLTPTTPPLTMLFALDAAVGMIEAETLPVTLERHRALGEMTRAGIRELNLELLADESVASNTVTTVKVPEGVTATQIIAAMQNDHGVTIAGGQAHIAEKVIRIGHMGWVDSDDIEVCLAALDHTIEKLRN